MLGIVNEVEDACRVLVGLLKPLVNPYSEYYSDGLLNSEGMTLLSRAVAVIMSSMPNLASLARKARRRRDYLTVFELIREVYSACGEEQPSPWSCC